MLNQTHLLDFDRAAPPPAPTLPSCDPARFRFKKLNVVRWKNRYRPCNRVIPPSIDLGILSRARTRIPLRSVRWLVTEVKAAQPDRTHWTHRLPRRYLDSLVDTTVELFIQQKRGMTAREIRDIFKAYLERRHTYELGARCNRGFFLFYVQRGHAAGKADIEKRFGLRRFGLSLDRLYARGGVTPGRSVACPRKPDEVPQRFFLLAYVTLPNEIEAKLHAPLPKPKPKPKPVPKPSVRQKIREVLEDLKKMPKGERRTRTMCLARKLGKRGTDARYVSEFQAHGYASKSAASAPQPWEMTEDARQDFRDAIRLTSTRKAFLKRVLAIDEDIFAGLQRVNREYQMTGAAPPSAPARRMRNWVAAQQKDGRSIYSCYTS